MRLVSLSVRQWRSFERLDLDLPDGLIAVRGDNGAGKTTIAEAIGWAFFGRLRPGAKVGELRRQDAPAGAHSSVELVFRMGDVVYRVERFVGGAARLWIGDSPDPETTQTRATNTRIAQELDMNWETFQRTVFASQKDVAALDPTGTSDARRRHVERLLGLERFRMAAERARSATREIEHELEGRRKAAPNVEELRQQLAYAEEAATKSDPNVAAAKLAVEDAKAELKRLADAYEGEQSREQAAQNREAAEGRLKKLEDQLAARIDATARLEEIEAAASGAEEAQKTAHAWKELKDAHDEHERAERELRDIDYNEERAEELAESLASARHERDELANGRLPESLRELRDRVTALKQAENASDLDEAADRLTEIEGKQRSTRESRAVLHHQLEHDREHLKTVREGGAAASCPTCLREYGADFEAILNRYQKRVQEAERKLIDLDEALDRHATENERAKAAFETAQQADEAVRHTTGAETLTDAEAAVEAAEREERESGERRDSLDKEIQQLEPVMKAQATAREACERQQWLVDDRSQRLSRAQAALGVEQYDADAHETARARAEECTSLQKEVVDLRAQVTATANIEESIADEQTAVKTAGGAEQTAELTLTALGIQPGRIDELKVKRDEAEQARDRQLEAYYNARSDARASSQAVQDLHGRIKEAKRVHDEIAVRQVDFRQHQVASELLNNFRTAQAQRAWPRLEQGASELLDTVTEGRYADVRLSEDYRIVVVDRGEEHGLSRYSGGEQDLANLCLRLAIADWVARERGVEIGFVVLDEVFGSQDETRRHNLLDELRRLAERFRQLLVITHLPDIADLCDQQLDVTLAEPGLSRAEFLP